MLTMIHISVHLLITILYFEFTYLACLVVQLHRSAFDHIINYGYNVQYIEKPKPWFNVCYGTLIDLHKYCVLVWFYSVYKKGVVILSGLGLENIPVVEIMKHQASQCNITK